MTAGTFHRVGVHPHDRNVRKHRRHFHLQPLSPEAGKLDRRIAAIGALFGRRNLMIAVVTRCLVTVLVMSQRDAAIRAGFHVAAGRTLNPSRKASPVEQQNHLAVICQRVIDFIAKLLADRTEAFAAAEIGSQINRRHVGQRQVEHSFAQGQRVVLLVQRALIRFQ